MNVRLLCKQLGLIACLIGVFMLFSLPWAFPVFGRRYGFEDHFTFEHRGFWALLISAAISGLVGGLLLAIGRSARGRMYRKEAMAIVGLSWMLATLLGATPYLLSGTFRGPAVRVFSAEDQPQVVERAHVQWYRTWRPLPHLSDQQYRVIAAICHAPARARGLSRLQLIEQSGVDDAAAVFRELQQQPDWQNVLLGPGDDRRAAPADRANHYRVRWVRMTVVDALFESQSGFSTTGATVLADLEDDRLVPYCILFWRSSTQFLGGLGIIVLFVVILGQGSAGKALMRAEMPGPSKEGATARMQHTAWMFAAIYIGLNAILAVSLMVIGTSPFDAICHAFTTISTGGFSTYNASIGYYATWDPGRGVVIEYLITLFMILGGTNFLLLYFCLLRQPGKLLSDIEWRTYIGIILVAVTLLTLVGIWHHESQFNSPSEAFRYTSFQVVSILTTTGFGTADYDQWSHLARAAMWLLMFVGGCAGSTSGSLKVIRHVLFAKILRLETERTYHPRVVRLLQIGGKTVDDQQLRRSILLYFGFILALLVGSSLLVIAIEPASTFGPRAEHRILDSASAVTATLNNIGPALGIAGPSENYSNFSGITKLLMVWLMMLGRLEIFPILVLFLPRFWRDQ